jgi:hypothetical protein
MRYIKKFESGNNEANIGQYVKISKNKWKGKSEYKEFDAYVEFLNNNIGQIVAKTDNYGLMVYLVKYNDMPRDIDNWCETHGCRDNLFKIPQLKTIRITKYDNFAIGDIEDEVEINYNGQLYNL